MYGMEAGVGGGLYVDCVRNFALWLYICRVTFFDRGSCFVLKGGKDIIS